ncbi:fungal cellulose binding domain-containing protein [Neurospora crassa OR74A]|uniref:Feruloyl esterase D n=1 Tax=Neurospora crassa (strain ATCC 24698 / 74-OR23-1A / CBS 708.71 / DSM 1257 / FGSC 987) TaxID=367110 RepID=FAED_NEUCR|nr:fungal cellulose binding domain-containing protein [Neurospora crassa OR74A]Q7RWX8.1 RecName: Full=Feruloyl esterase D; AltName: Full=Ferulic acid esterase D; Short=FAE; Flags: Precursor [Neurospora crassa OR74A]EAA26992.1 fungal cellulose binding domain-containing protein [Neurospora crassa OR74A]|eukprot:XP_956228.1 fungal cellulose binding domain-containing protein [Neurospora crassa OR74A]
MAGLHSRLTTFLLLLLSALPAIAAAAPSSGCGKGPTLRNGQTVTTNINGKSRRYTVRLPDNYNQNNPYRLIFLWHPLGSSMQKIIQGEDPNRGGVLPYYGLPPLDTSKSAIYVVPDGLNAGWANQNGEDVSFFDNILQTVSDGLCIDTNLVFSTGFSYGGGMSFSLACSRANKVRAVAVISGAQLSGCAGGNDPVAYYAQHGTSDGVLNVAMGRQLRDRFVRNNGCQPANGEVQPGSGGRSTRVEYQGCQQGKDVVWVVHGGDHNPSQRDPGQNDPFAPRNTWEFFSRFN